MLPQIYSNIHWLPSTKLVDHDYKAIKISTIWYQCNKNYTQDIMAHTPKKFQTIHIYLIKSEEASIWIFIHLFFESAMILIFGGLLLLRISWILKFKINWIRVPKLISKDKKPEPVGRIQIQLRSVERQKISLPRDTPKIDPFFLNFFKVQGMPHTFLKSRILRQSWIWLLWVISNRW